MASRFPPIGGGFFSVVMTTGKRGFRGFIGVSLRKARRAFHRTKTVVSCIFRRQNAAPFFAFPVLHLRPLGHLSGFSPSTMES